MTIKTRKGNPNKATRLVICGTPGIGKSTLGAKADKPVFLPLEDGVDHLKDRDGNGVDVLESVITYDDARARVEQLLKEDHKWQTLVVDSADWLEKLIHAKIIGPNGTDIVRANKGYGAGFAQSTKIHSEFLKLLTELREKKNMNIIVTAHTHIKPVKDPAVMEDYDAFEMKCHKEVSDLWREWSDAFLFAKKPVFTKTNDDSVRARALMDDTREVFTTEQPFFKAKNRYGLPEKMNFTEKFWDEFVAYRVKAPEPATAQDKPKKQSVEDLRSEIEHLSQKASSTVLPQIKQALDKAGNDHAGLVMIRDRVIELTKGVA